MADKPEGPSPKPSFLSTTTGMLTALATTIASVTALVTALYTAGVIGHKGESPTPAPTPIVRNEPVQPVPAPNGGGHIKPAINTADEPPADARAENRRNAAESIEGGQYVLQSYKINGQFVPVRGALELTKQPDDDFQFRFQVTNGALTYWYQGMLRYRNGVWREQILGSNDPTVNSMPIPISMVEGDGSLVVKGAGGVETEWLKQ